MGLGLSHRCCHCHLPVLLEIRRAVLVPVFSKGCFRWTLPDCREVGVFLGVLHCTIDRCPSMRLHPCMLEGSCDTCRASVCCATVCETVS